MKTRFVSPLAFAAMFALSPALAPTLAQETGTKAEQSNAEDHDPSQTWQHPDRIAEIEDDSERIRAFSVLIGQSVYDEMLKAEAARAMDQDSSDSTDAMEPSEGSGEDSANPANEEIEQEGSMASDPSGSLDGSTSNDAQDDASEDEPNAVSEGLTIEIVNIAQLLDPADVLALELLAEANQQELTSLQAVLNLDERTRTSLEEEGMLPADVVGIQRTPSSLDIFVIPDWLNE